MCSRGLGSVRKWICRSVCFCRSACFCRSQKRLLQIPGTETGQPLRIPLLHLQGGLCRKWICRFTEADRGICSLWPPPYPPRNRKGVSSADHRSRQDLSIHILSVEMAKPQNSAHRERCFAEEKLAFASCIAYRPKSMVSVCFVEQQEVFDRCMQRATTETQIQKGTHIPPFKHSRPADPQ